MNLSLLAPRLQTIAMSDDMPCKESPGSLSLSLLALLLLDPLVTLASHRVAAEPIDRVILKLGFFFPSWDSRGNQQNTKPPEAALILETHPFEHLFLFGDLKLVSASPPHSEPTQG